MRFGVNIKLNEELLRQVFEHRLCSGMDDNTITKDKEQRGRYRKRHTNIREDCDNPMSAGSLSYHILWGQDMKY